VETDAANCDMERRFGREQVQVFGDEATRNGVRLSCKSDEQSCAADGDLITTVIQLLTPQDSNVRSEVTVMTRVEALVSCKNTVARLSSAGLALEGGSILAERPARSAFSSEGRRSPRS
jgi:hypothetical protein